MAAAQKAAAEKEEAKGSFNIPYVIRAYQIISFFTENFVFLHNFTREILPMKHFSKCYGYEIGCKS